MLETKRFILRKLIDSDASMVYNNLCHDKEVTKYLINSYHSTLEDTKDYISFIICSNQMVFAIVDRMTSEVIGIVSNVREYADYKSVEIGYLLQKKYWHQGVMTEVLNKYLDYLFTVIGYSYVEAKHVFENHHSGSLLKKMGMRETLVKEEYLNNLGIVKLVYYELTKDAFYAKKFHQNLVNKLGNKLPFYEDTKMLIRYLLNNNYLVKQFTLIDDDKIMSCSSDFVFVGYTSSYLLRTYYFVCEKSNIDQFNKVINEFLQTNNMYIICEDDKPIENQLVNLLIKKNFKISFSESCTGGLLVSTLINVSGASNVIEESYVTYSEDAKRSILGVKEDTLKKYSVYSKEVAKEMVEGLYKISSADVCVSVTGLAGGIVKSFNDGSFDFAIRIKNKFEKIIYQEHKVVYGDRLTVRKKQVNYIYYKILDLLKKY